MHYFSAIIISTLRVSWVYFLYSRLVYTSNSKNKKVFSLFPPEKADWNFFEMIVVYTLSVAEGSEDVLTETIKSIPPPLKDNIMTLYDLLIEKGETQGEIKGKAQMILALYDDNIGISQIARYAKITEEEVLKILKENGRVK